MSAPECFLKTDARASPAARRGWLRACTHCPCLDPPTFYPTENNQIFELTVHTRRMRMVDRLRMQRNSGSAVNSRRYQHLRLFQPLLFQRASRERELQTKASEKPPVDIVVMETIVSRAYEDS